MCGPPTQAHSLSTDASRAPPSCLLLTAIRASDTQLSVQSRSGEGARPVSVGLDNVFGPRGRQRRTSTTAASRLTARK